MKNEGWKDEGWKDESHKKGGWNESGWNEGWIDLSRFQTFFWNEPLFYFRYFMASGLISLISALNSYA